MEVKGSSSKWLSSVSSLCSNCSLDILEAQIRTLSIFLSIHSEVNRNYLRIVKLVVLATEIDFQFRFKSKCLIASDPNLFIICLFYACLLINDNIIYLLNNIYNHFSSGFFLLFFAIDLEHYAFFVATTLHWKLLSLTSWLKGDKT